MANTIDLNRIRLENRFDFKAIYEQIAMDDEEDDSINNQIVNSDYYDPEEFHKNFAKLQGIISYFHINCRSLSSNWEAFRELLCEMHGEDFAFDFIGMSEVFGKYKDDRINLP